MAAIVTPASTYRIQFHSRFRFSEAKQIVGYLRTLGITDLYSSPLLRACPGSTHGYDVVDAAQINPELGTEAEFEEMLAALKTVSLGLTLDIVPNHMAASPENSWWMSVLENGPHSRFINYFDIEWNPSPGDAATELNKVLLPVLGKPYGEALEGLELKLGFDERGFFILYYERRFPVAPWTYSFILRECLERLSLRGKADSGGAFALRELIEEREGTGSPSILLNADRGKSLNSKFLKETLWRLYNYDDNFRTALDEAVRLYAGKKGDPRALDRLDHLLENQWYRLAYWRMASEEINYRRFFDISDLVGVRIEDPEVFEARHSRIFKLVEQGKITGLRVDHIDGLYDPVSHLRKLQARLGAGWNGKDRSPSFYVVVEKILARGEKLPDSFAASGTTGYEFLNQLNDLFVDPQGLMQLGVRYGALTGDIDAFEEVRYRSKRRVIEELFAGEIRTLGNKLVRLAGTDRNARDYSPQELMQGLVEVTAALPVYRTYIRDSNISQSDRQTVEGALRAAEARSAGRVDPRVYAFLHQLLLVTPPHYAKDRRGEWLNFVMRWQQFTGRVMAKGMEDTSFYIYNRLISMNEVGGEPGEIGRDSLDEFHRQNGLRRDRWPHNMNATSTHDTKRSEDMRARIDVLSEIPEMWDSHVTRWMAAGESGRSRVGERTAPSPGEELMIYQTLLGVWPLDMGGLSTLKERLCEFVRKALREAKVNSSWLNPDEEYESAVCRFVSRLVGPESEEFRVDFLRLQQRVAHYGFINSLSQVVIKIASPGVPDFYQGTELWDFSLVDPDNRRPVDFRLREEMLREFGQRTGGDLASLASQLLNHWKDGRIKLYVTFRGLHLRRDRRDLFLEGSYIPLTATGDAGQHVIAFARARKGKWVIAAAPRLLTRMISPTAFPLGEKVWGDSDLDLPQDAPAVWRNIFTGETVTAVDRKLPLAFVFKCLPVALLQNA